ncbi:laminin subunit beta-4 [Spea bombifrons]|uniref:laminin subunit beta-4 n=1 Tax=Spea bombifrons TaxID=233779 RepID=UPI00234BF6F2|nr:laminin subunit beta-4 [Spea bombifrons]
MTLLHFTLIFTSLVSIVKTQESCQSASCHPTIGDLLVGRSQQLLASSTCGLDEPQRYCIVSYLEDGQKCFTCDSRYPYNPYTHPNSHLIENIITTFDPNWKNKWWQSENGNDYVSIRLDLETLFQFSHLIITFKTFRPAAMLVERSRDFGKTWKVFRYFAQNCASAFPDVKQGYATNVGDVVCDSRYSDLEPSTEGEVILKALDPNFDIEDPYDPFIQDLITITNLRINFTKLHTLGDTTHYGGISGPEAKYYYAIYEMIVKGSCFCNGHASECIPVENSNSDLFSQPGMVHGKCVCQHNTDGVNCETCKEFYNDAPWRPAIGVNDNACMKCNCNGHSNKCHFDMNAYLSNNGTSGGVCEDCQHNTHGNQCEQCKPYFYHDPLKHICDINTCIPCDCDPEGTIENGLCESQTDESRGTMAGKCICKQNVEGFRCDQCKHGYFGLNPSDPLGCRYCNCNPFGSLPSSICDPISGQCQCQKYAVGRYCEECLPGYWGLGNSLYHCSPCNCDIGGAHNNLCSQSNGQCNCLPNIIGRQCNEPAQGYYFISLDYYIYEAENAQALAKPASIIDPSPMPKCKDYFLQQGIDFRFENGRIILKKMSKRSFRRRRQVQEILPYGKQNAVELVLRQPTSRTSVTWTGPGFARVQNGAGLRFTVNNIPYSMDFVIAIRFEPESLENWTARIVINQPQGPVSERCRSGISLNTTYSLHLAATTRLSLLNTSVCLDPDTEYVIDVYFNQLSNVALNDKVYILIDSLGLIPKLDSVNNLCSKEEVEEYDYYNCIEIASEVGTEILPHVCERLIGSLSARMHHGAVKCTCNKAGSLTTSCSKFGGRCSCKPNVVGSCCDRCAVGSYGFGPNGCKECGCHSNGSISPLCDQVTGQCACRSEIQGRQCDSCLPGYYGFPNCRPCQCNGNSELCDPVTGACRNCKNFTNGTNCERCIDNYFGNPVLGLPCRPCMCPGSPTSNQFYAHSCNQDPNGLVVVCNCLHGYTGRNCNKCPPGFYGNLDSGEVCLPCQCNNNTDVTDPKSCDKITGKCLKCLHNTYGANCESCLPGYFGSALRQSCTKCGCNSKGSTSPLCDQVTGQCACRSEIQGRRCDSCLPGYYGFPNCRPCQCNGNSELCDPVTGACLKCKKFTNGTNCERCIDNYFGNPILGLPCRPCMCPGSPTSNQFNAHSCNQDPNSLVVVCNCLHGYTGKNCNDCPSGFYGNLDSEDVCLPCQCSNNIDVTDPESCDKITGECLKCLHNTYGANCESCLPGYFGSALRQNCTSCDCNPLGTNAANCLMYEEVGECVCDKTTGQCPCLPNVIGINCDTCASGYWGMANGKECQPCDCNANGSSGKQCNQLTGQCTCKPKYKGQKCDQCIDNYYGNPKVQCTSCKCNLEGTQEPYCDKDTGACNCKVGVTGRYCDQCAPKFKQEFPKCPRCHMCFDPLDSEVTTLSHAVHGLVRLAANIGPDRNAPVCEVQIDILKEKLTKIEKIFRSPIFSPQKYKQVKSYYDLIRQKFSKLKVKDYGDYNEIPKMNRTIGNMEKEIDELFKELDKVKRKKEKENVIRAKAFEESFDKITKHYKISLSAGEQIRDVTPIIKTATKTRKQIVAALSNLDARDKQNSDKINKMTSLDIRKMNQMVCGTVWDFPCNVAPCGGALCKDRFGNRKCGGPNCNGALPLANGALKKANETGLKLSTLSFRLFDAEKRIESIRQLAEDTKLKASKLNKTLSKAMVKLEADRSRSKELIKSVKDFLLDSTVLYYCPKRGTPNTPQEVEAFVSPEEIEKVANQILAIKLPAAPYDLIDTLNKIKAYCDDYKRNKNNLKKQLEEVNKLTQRAKEAKKVVENLPNGDEIRINLKNAENLQQKVTSILNSITKEIQDIRNKISRAKARADTTDDKLKAIKDFHSKLETKIAELQEKMLRNKNEAAKAQKRANTALKQATESENSLNDLKEKYELLQEKLKKRDIPPELLERIERLKKEAEDVVTEIGKKSNRISELEEKIDDINKETQDKVNQLKDLEEQVIALKNSILKEENIYSICKS